MKSTRLDEALVARGLVPSRARAKDVIARGLVRVDGAPARKAAQPVIDQTDIAIDHSANLYVSRAAFKLVHGLEHFGINPAGRECLDIGASTGGFTQVLLDRGAAHVTAIDVGHGQMAEAIAGDPRVTLIEGLNARHVTEDHLPKSIGMIVCDVSFISLKLALPPVLSLAPVGAVIIALVKPQFEVGRDGLGKGGIVRDEALHQKVCDDIAAFVVASGWQMQGLAHSPISGGDGNQEFLLAAVKTA